MVVEGKVADRHEVQAGIALCLPVARTQVGADGFGSGGIDVAAPVLFEGELQFALGAHAWEAESVGACHPAIIPRRPV